jgi:hypothetical protein
MTLPSAGHRKAGYPAFAPPCGKNKKTIYKIILFQQLKACRVARFFLVQLTKNGKKYTN